MNHTLNQLGHKQTISFGDYQIFYDNLTSAKQIISGVTNFTPRQPIASQQPFIIDAGSNIGISALFFKSLYPKAKLLCFEPDPHAFGLLEKNILHNRVLDTSLFAAALSNQSGEIDFFGQIFVEAPDARGNSIFDTWGLQRATSNTTKVKAVKLSAYIDTKVDFLKLNIEGAEQQVIEDLAKTNKLSLIEEIAIEVHQSKSSKELNDLNTITNILAKHKFALEVIKKDKSSRLPAEISAWVASIKPEFFSLRAIRQ